MRGRGVLLGAMLVIAAGGRWAQAGPFTQNGTQPFLTHPILTPVLCRQCHGDFDATTTAEPWPLWSGSMMAQASRDPIFWAALDVANHDVAGIGDWCLRCHVPEGWFAGRSEPPGGSVDGCGLVGPLDDLFGDFNGVSCHFCHRMQVNPTPPPGQPMFFHENGQFWLDDGDCGGLGEPCRHGPYDYPMGGGFFEPPHPWQYSPFHQSADLCSGCHNVTSPAHNLIDNGIDTGIPFPIERTEREWSQSVFGQPGPDFAPCQGCHMPDATDDPVFACNEFLNNRTGDLPQHIFAGGNAWIPEVLRQEYPNLFLDAELAATRDAALDMLQNRSATVEVSAPGVARSGDALPVSVTVTNQTGHKLPTGYPEGRRMWLHVEARDATDAVVWESGGWDAGTGELASDPQLKVYEAKQGIWDLNGTGSCDTVDGGGSEVFHFVLNNCIALDNRLPPRGFTGGSNPETRPVGVVYPETAPGSGVLVHWDVTTYDVPIPASAVSPITISATLEYQTSSKEYVEFLRDEAVTHGFPDDCIPRSTGLPGKSRGALLHDFWSGNGRSAPVAMGTAVAEVAVAAGDAEDCYSARTSKGAVEPPLPTGVLVGDVFGSGLVDLKAVRGLCTPAAVGSDVLDPSIRLVSHVVKSSPGEPRRPRQRGVGVRDVFGSLTLDLVKADRLLVPASLDPTMPPPPPADPSLDAYLCYKAKTSAGTPKLAKGLQATVDDEFTTGGSVRDVKKLKRLCLPADVGDGIDHPDALLTCYLARPAKGQPRHDSRSGLNVTTSLTGARRVDTRKEDLLCLPAVRE
jgi:hypothetical protein